MFDLAYVLARVANLARDQVVARSRLAIIKVTLSLITGILNRLHFHIELLVLPLDALMPLVIKRRSLRIVETRLRRRLCRRIV